MVDKMTKAVSKKERCMFASSLIRAQLGDSPEHRLTHAIVERAILDYHDPKGKTAERDRVTAERFLLGDMPGVQLCDIDPDWIRRLLKYLGIL